VTKNIICDSKCLSGGHIRLVRCHVVVKFAIGSSGGVAGYLTLQGIVILSDTEPNVVDPIGEYSMSPRGFFVLNMVVVIASSSLFIVNVCPLTD
jgi:hypothetical protein